MRHLALLAALCAGLAGCTGGDTNVSKAEEEAFRNPPKEIPPESLKAMQEAREKGARQAQEAMRKAQEANRAAGNRGGN